MDKEIVRFYKSLIMEDYKRKFSYSFLTEISVITIKSFIPSTLEIGVRIDYKRFQEELNLWRYYRSGYNKALYNLEDTNYEIYFGEKDDSILFRIIPLLSANKEISILENEVIKNILFTTGNIETLLENLLLSYIVFYIKKRENIIEILKNVIIKFSQDEYLKLYGQYYKYGPRNEKKFKIEFELAKINVINLFNGIDIKGYESLKEVLKILELDFEEPETMWGKVIVNYLSKEFINIDRFYLNLEEYLLKLRLSRVNPEKLIIDNYILPDIFNYNKGDNFFHSLLGNGTVIDKKNNEVLLRTKSGEYLLRK